MLVLFFFFQFILIFRIHVLCAFMCLIIMCFHFRNKNVRILAVSQSFCDTNNDIAETYRIIDYNLPKMMWYDKRTCALLFRTGYMNDWCDLLDPNPFFVSMRANFMLKTLPSVFIIYSSNNTLTEKMMKINFCTLVVFQMLKVNKQ